VERPLVEVPGSARPSALVYAPGDGWCNLDAREPDLQHRDWLQSLWLGLAYRKPFATRVAGAKPQLFDWPQAAMHPEDVLYMQFRVGIPVDPPSPHVVPSLEVETADGRFVSYGNIIDDVPRRSPTGVVSLIYNAKFSFFHVYARLPPELTTSKEVVTRLRLTAVLDFAGTMIRSDPVVVRFSASALRKPVSPILPEPTTDQLCDAFRHFPTIERSRRGAGYAVFDLSQMASRPR
jgi:hypothetical protein